LKDRLKESDCKKQRQKKKALRKELRPLFAFEISRNDRIAGIHKKASLSGTSFVIKKLEVETGRTAQYNLLWFCAQI
jgi:hypothetical protein